MWLFAIGFRQRQIAGGDIEIFIMVGVLGFFLPRNMLTRGTMAVDVSEMLYAFRNVKPVDAVIARVGLESLLGCLVFVVVCTGAGFLGYPVFPADPLGALQALAALWLAGLGLALILSMVPMRGAFGRLPVLMSTPLYIFSAVMYPSIVLPSGMREVILLNP